MFEPLARLKWAVPERWRASGAPKGMTTRLACVVVALGSCVGVDVDIAIEDPDRYQAVIDCDEPIVFGHRGTTLQAPENTLPAFLWAMDHGADGIELDVKRTRDGVLVALHDRTTGRTTDDADDRPVAELTLAELRELDAGIGFGDDFAGTRIPTLDEVFDAVPTPALIDIDQVNADVVDDVAAFLTRRGEGARVVVSSFDEQALGVMAQRLPEVPRVLFLGSIDDVATTASSTSRCPSRCRPRCAYPKICRPTSARSGGCSGEGSALRCRDASCSGSAATSTPTAPARRQSARSSGGPSAVWCKRKRSPAAV